MNNKVIRSICLFEKSPNEKSLQKLDEIESVLKSEFTIQTKRLCSPDIQRIIELSRKYSNKGYFFGLGAVEKEIIETNLVDFLSANVRFNLDLTNKRISLNEVQILFDIIKNNPTQTFNFAYEFNNPFSSPFFPSGHYERNGFSIGFQLTDLTDNCNLLEDWFSKIDDIFVQLINRLKNYTDFLGIDSSIAPLFSGKSSLINFTKKLKSNFEKSVTTDFYTQITDFIKKENPKPIGLCGLMFPCLEDFELADEYEKGNFGIERNIYLSLHSGLGIDTYPIGINERPERVLEIIKLLQALSNKYKKAFSARFVSDGKAKIGEKTDFKNQYLKDVVVQKL